MNKEILNIDLGFENCETHTYKGDYIENLVLRDTYRITSDCYENCYKANEFYIKLSPQANKSDNIDENLRDWSKYPFTRTIKFDDLCDVTITYLNGLIEHYELEWCDLDDNWQENAYQKSLIDVDGNLHISVHARNKEELNDTN